MQRYEAVRQLYLQGISLSEIARRFQMGRMTVQKFAYAEIYQRWNRPGLVYVGDAFLSASRYCNTIMGKR